MHRENKNSLSIIFYILFNFLHNNKNIEIIKETFLKRLKFISNKDSNKGLECLIKHYKQKITESHKPVIFQYTSNYTPYDNFLIASTTSLGLLATKVKVTEVSKNWCYHNAKAKCSGDLISLQHSHHYYFMGRLYWVSQWEEVCRVWWVTERMLQKQVRSKVKVHWGDMQRVCRPVPLLGH